MLLGSNKTKQLMHIFCICFAVCYLVKQQENKIIVSNWKGWTNLEWCMWNLKKSCDIPPVLLAKHAHAKNRNTASIYWKSLLYWEDLMHNSGELYSLCTLKWGFCQLMKLILWRLGQCIQRGGGRLNRGNYSGIPANGLEASSQSRSV